MINEFLPARYRKVTYVVYALIGVTLGAVAVGYAEADVDIPTWVQVATAVYTFVGGAVGLTAAVHVTPAQKGDVYVTSSEAPEATDRLQRVLQSRKARRRAEAEGGHVEASHRVPPEVIDEPPQAPEK